MNETIPQEKLIQGQFYEGRGRFIQGGSVVGWRGVSRISKQIRSVPDHDSYIRNEGL